MIAFKAREDLETTYFLDEAPRSHLQVETEAVVTWIDDDGMPRGRICDKEEAKTLFAKGHWMKIQ